MFDLDDTLYKEQDFVRSGFNAVAELLKASGRQASLEELLALRAAGCQDPFATILARCGANVAKEDLVAAYRDHHPRLSLSMETSALLNNWRSSSRTIGLITDGRSVTQRNKIAALGLAGAFDYVVISEEIGASKPNELSFRSFESRYPGRELVYVGDNLAKDFVTPNRLGWTTVCLLDDGRNIHPQDFDVTPEDHLPQHCIQRIA